MTAVFFFKKKHVLHKKECHIVYSEIYIILLNGIGLLFSNGSRNAWLRFVRNDQALIKTEAKLKESLVRLVGD